jgi:L-rhamnose-H+ transport protein
MALVWGAPIARQAQRLGADPFYSANAIWCLSVGVGSLPSLALTMFKIGKRQSWRQYALGPVVLNTGLCAFMGFLWISGTVLYGSATGILGPLGPAIGWPVYMSSMILASNFWGWLTGEWKRVSGRPVWFMLIGIVIQILAMVLLGRLQ